MSTTSRFPHPLAGPGFVSDASLIIELLTNSNAAIPLGGPAIYTDISAWKTDGNAGDESPFQCIMIEWTADGAITIGDGDSGIGLYGCIGKLDSAASNPGQRYLLRTLGFNYGETYPQIKFFSANGLVMGFAQPVSEISQYDGLAIGGIDGTIAVSDAHITVTARPIFKRNYVG